MEIRLSLMSTLWVLFIVLKLIHVVTWSWWIVVFWPVGVWALLALSIAFLAACGHVYWEFKRAKL